jgi:tetratricopeptide (TPR) repeat protein
MIATVLLLVWYAAIGPQQLAADEDAIRAQVQRYFDAQAAKDSTTVMALWLETAPDRPTPGQLTALFESGDDKYTIAVSKVVVNGDSARASVSIQRVRTIVHGGATNVFRSEALDALTFVRRPDGWRITSEHPVVDEIVDAIVAADPAERVKLLSDPGTNIAPVRQGLASRASGLAIGQRYPEAQALYEVLLTAARAAKDQRAESETLHNIGNTLYFQREFAKAGEFYSERLALARDMKDEEGQAASLTGIATIAYSRGEYTPALTAYRGALAYYERAGWAPAIGSTLIGIGNVQFLQADYQAAAETYERAVSLLDKAGDPSGVTLARGGMARVFAARGDLVAALQIHREILEAARRGAAGPLGVDIAATLESIGELHYRLGNVDQARGAFDEARRISDERHDPATAGRLLGDLGLTELVAGKFEAALADYTESRGRFEKAQNPEGVARAWVGIGFSQTALENFADAITAYRIGIRLLDEQKLEEESARAWLGLSMAQSGAGELPAALESAQHVARAAAAPKSPRDLKWRAAVRIGEVQRQLNHLDEAKQSFDDALSAIAPIVEAVATDANARSDLDGSEDAWAGLAFTQAQRGDPTSALIAEEQRRGHLRRIVLAPFERDIVRGATPEERNRERQNVRDLISARAQVRAERAAKAPDSARLARLQAQLTDLLSAREAQQAALYARLPELKRWRGLQALPALVDLNTLLEATGALVIEYVVMDDELLILTAAHGTGAPDVTAAIVPVRRRELIDRITPAVEAASLRDVDRWRTRSSSLVAPLISPIASRLSGHDRYVVVPDEALWRIPFEALVFNGQSLGARARVTYATSLVALAALRDAQPAAASDTASANDLATATTTVGIVAGPEIAPGLRAQLTVVTPSWSPPDPAAAIEKAQRIASMYDSRATVVSGAGATEAAVQRLTATVDVLELDAPFQIIAPSPLFSAVLLAGGAGTDEGRWELRKWFADTGRARILIVPDGSAFSSLRTGSAMDAMAWAAACAGVSTIAVGRWPGDGYATEPLLAAWHERLAKSARAPAEAFSDAAASIRAAAGDAPSVWAGIRLIDGSSAR